MRARRRQASIPPVADSPITKRLTIVLAVGGGLSVGNLYYAQPLLYAIGKDLHVGYREAGFVVTLSQVGYLLGLVLLVPLGDLVQRRKLVVLLLTLTCLALAAAGLAPSIAALDIAIVIVGFCTVVPQILVPFAAELAPEGQRGKIVGAVMSGLLIGLLVVRTISGVLAQLGTWRVAFLVAAGAMLALALMLRRELPFIAQASKLSYRKLMRSIAQIAKSDAMLRWRSFYGAIIFACFSVLWTSIAFLLAGPPYHYGPALIGLFGLLGAAGAVMANVAGRIADAGHSHVSTGICFAVLACSFGLLAIGGEHLSALIAGVIVLDLAVQSIQIFNQATIYAHRPASRSRVTTVYMTTYFVGGAVGSAATASVYAASGWDAVCVLGAGFGALGAAAWVLQTLRRHMSSQRVDGNRAEATEASS